MSWTASGIVRDLSDNLTAREKFLLLLLSEHANPHSGQCNPSIPRLAKELLSSERHLYRLIRQLKAKGFLRVESGGGARSSQYWLTLPAPTPDIVTSPDTTAKQPLTPRSVTPDTDVRQKEKETKYERKESLSSASPQRESTPKHKPIDMDFLTDMSHAFPALDVEREHEKFEDYCAANGKRYRDYRAAFRNWLRKAEEFQRQRQPQRSGFPGEERRSGFPGEEPRRGRSMQ